MNLRGLLDGGDGGRLALRQPGGVDIAYDRLRASVDALAAALAARGVAPGDRVAASLLNGPAIVVAFFGIAAARAGAAPLNPAYTRDEYTFYLEDIAPKAILVAPGASPLARDAAASVLGIDVIEIALDAAGRS